MQSRILFGSCLVAVVVTGLAAASLANSRQSAIADITEPTLIGSTFVVGPVVFTHDDAKTARGEPCTTVHLFDPAMGRATEEIASFHCIPRRGQPRAKLTITTRPSRWGYGCVLTSYQFAGDPEIHGVPEPADVH
jgi:hypothetical protein